MQPHMAKNFSLILNCMQEKERRAGLASQSYRLRGRRMEDGEWDHVPRLQFLSYPQHTASLGDISVRKDFVPGAQLRTPCLGPEGGRIGVR